MKCKLKCTRCNNLDQTRKRPSRAIVLQNFVSYQFRIPQSSIFKCLVCSRYVPGSQRRQVYNSQGLTHDGGFMDYDLLQIAIAIT